MGLFTSTLRRLNKSVTLHVLKAQTAGKNEQSTVKILQLGGVACKICAVFAN